MSCIDLTNLSRSSRRLGLGSTGMARRARWRRRPFGRRACTRAASDTSFATWPAGPKAHQMSAVRNKDERCMEFPREEAGRIKRGGSVATDYVAASTLVALHASRNE